ncbi:hypothetical protein GCM10011405_29190 [Rufibacter glacialis]|uniref:Tyrosine-type recombinase/integrase n=1 Tax=Rufibacter glacialis TaxID=1259555 RepID=A0A5M8QBV2_9BACT|nr:tyrosine-type recombinase/integrase [Rufibacter glacialis]GGK79546.1 hypothetical protein GCM10011405_29190 [Rufibacter glacialis]
MAGGKGKQSFFSSKQRNFPGLAVCGWEHTERLPCQYKEKDGIRALPTPFTLRHSFAMHLLVQCMDLHYIQAVLEE